MTINEICEKLRCVGFNLINIEAENRIDDIPYYTIRGTFHAPQRTEQKKEPMQKKNPYAVKKILKNGDYMTVLWEDGDKTIVKRAEDEPESDYAAFTAALGRKVYGSNSALKRLVASAEEQKTKKKKAPTEKRANDDAVKSVNEQLAKDTQKIAAELSKAFGGVFGELNGREK